MNFVYAAKILIGFLMLSAGCALLLRRRFLELGSERDWRLGWTAIIGTMSLAAFGWLPLLFLFMFGIFSAWLAMRPGQEGKGWLPLYALLVAVGPPIQLAITDLGPIEYLLRLNVYRVLSLSLLVPAILEFRRHHRGPLPGWQVFADGCVLVYSVLLINRLAGDGSASVIGRAIAEHSLDVLIPYFAMSRCLRDPAVFRRTLRWFLLGGCFIAVVCIVEFISGHLFYLQFQWLYGHGFFSSALRRGDWIRAGASAGPLPTAVLLLAAYGAWAVLRPKALRLIDWLIPALLVVGLVCTISRGPGLAWALLFASLLALRRLSVRSYLSLCLVGGTLLGLAWMSGMDELITQAVNFGPAGDTTAQFNVRYRQELLNTAIELIRQSPAWGVSNYYAYMEHLRQGEGIIDIVNTYILVTLNTGLVGLTFFVLPWLVALVRLGRRTPDGAVVPEAATWAAVMVATMVVILTVSPVSVVQPLTLMVLGAGLALTFPWSASRFAGSSLSARSATGRRISGVTR